LQSQHDLQQVVIQLLEEMHIDPDFQFRLVGVGVYQLQQAQEESQLSLW
jgi:DNA polymerase-4